MQSAYYFPSLVPSQDLDGMAVWPRRALVVSMVRLCQPFTWVMCSPKTTLPDAGMAWFCLNRKVLWWDDKGGELWDMVGSDWLFMIMYVVYF